MKKILLSAFALVFALAVGAQTEFCTVDATVTDGLDSKGTHLDAGTVLHEGTYIKWTTAIGEVWKSGGSSATYVINNDSGDKDSGVVGTNNPSTIKDDGTSISSINGSATAIPDTGCVYNFYAKSSGYLYVLAKLNTSKVVLVWEDGTRIPYIWTASDDVGELDSDKNVTTKASNTVLSFDLSKQSDILDSNGNILTSVTVGAPNSYISFSDGYESSYSADCQAGVIKIAVTEGSTYTVCACGSKMAVGGYYYDQTGDATITYEADDVTYTLLDEGKIASDEDEEEDEGDEGDGNDTDTATSYTMYWSATAAVQSTTDFFTLDSNYTSAIKSNQGSVTYNGETYSSCLQMTSDEPISFTAPEDSMVLTIIFGASDTKHDIRIDADEKSALKTAEAVYDESDGTTVLYYELVDTLANSGTHTLYKGDVAYLFYVSLTSTSTASEGDGTDTTVGDIEEANWDWENTNPANIQDFDAIEGNTGYIESDVDGLYLYVDASSGKVGPYADAHCAQFTQGAKLHVPVVNGGDVVTFKGYSGLTFKIGGGEEQTASGTAVTYTATSTDADNGYVEIESTGGTLQYMYSVSVSYTTAVSTDDISSDFIRPSVKLVSPTQDELDETPLAKETVIKVSVVNLPEDGIVWFTLYDSNGEDQGGGQCTLGDDGYYTYTWNEYFWDEQSSASETYTGTIRLYHNNNESENLIGDPFEIFTTVGLVEPTNITLDSVDPEAVIGDDEDATATIKTSQTEITLTFSGAVKVTSASMSYYTASDDDDVITISKTDEESEYATEWTLTLTEGMMSKAVEMGSLTLIVYAQDENGTTLGDYGYIQIKYTTVEEAGETFDVTVSPNAESEEDTQTSFSEITVTIDGTDVEIDESKLSEISLSSRTITGLGQISVSVKDEPTTTDEQTIYTLTLSGTVTGDGMLTYTLPEGLFTMGDAISNEVSGTVYLEEEIVYIDLTYDPESESEGIVGSLSSINVSCDEEYYMDLGANDITIYKNGEEVKDVTADAEPAEDENGDDIDNMCVITFTPALTEGTYTIVIGEGMITVGQNYTELGINAETTLTYTINAIEGSVQTSSVDADNTTIMLNYTADVALDTESTTIEDEEGNAVEYTVVTSADYSDTWILSIAEETITTLAGQTLTVNAVAADANGVEVTCTGEVSVASGDENTLTYSPADNEIVESLSSIVVSCNTGILCWADGTITITDADGTEIEVEASCPETEDYELAESCTITITPAITTVGTYTVTIPKGYFGLGEEWDDNDAITLTYTVSSTDGINGITLKAGADDRFYNLNGQRVTSPRNGVFILNGKKVLIK